jgi:hypothetical protein
MAYATCNKKRANVFGLSLLAAFLFAAGNGADVSAQALPWAQGQSPAGQSAQPQYPSQNPPQQQHHHHHNANNAAPAPHKVAGSNSARSQDDRKLDMLATKFYGITAKDPQVVSKLKRLQREVKEFRTGLADHGYDASDITSDAKKLEGRIAHQRKQLEAEAAAKAPAVPPEATTPPTPPAVSAPPAPKTAPALSPVAPLAPPGGGRS